MMCGVVIENRRSRRRSAVVGTLSYEHIHSSTSTAAGVAMCTDSMLLIENILLVYEKPRGYFGVVVCTTRQYNSSTKSTIVLLHERA